MSLQFFVADDGINGQELWVTNGTAAGTFLLKDINPGPGGSGVADEIQSNGIMYFTAYDGSARHLWRSDGTKDGTYLLTSASNGDNTSNLIDVNGTLYFLGSDSVHGAGLFKSDGTVVGTEFVKAVSGVSQMTGVGDTLFFQAYDAASGNELWKSDGTTAGTGLVKDIYPGAGSSSLGQFTASAGKLFFTADDGTHGTELWVSDGTAAGTTQIKDLNPGPDGSGANSLFAAGARVFFYANDGAHGTQFYSTDGTAANTLALATPLPATYAKLNNQLYYVAADSAGGSAIYTSDGSTVTKVAHLASFGGTFFNLGSSLMFQGNDGSHGDGLYTFDGSNTSFATTVPGGFSQATVSAGKLFFVSYDSAHGNELWVTDGTAAGTHLTADVNPGPYNADITNISAVGGGVVFSAVRPDVGRELFFSDGTQGATGLLADVNSTFDHSRSLNINSSFYAIGTTGKALFAAEDGIHGNELWIGDGTSAGSHMVSDAVVGGGSSDPGYFFQFGGKVYYTQYVDGVSGRQLYVSDGTTQTRLTTDGTGTTPYQYNPNFLTLGGKLYYLSAASGGGYDFITTDGTVTGTAKVAHADDVNSAFYQLGSTLVFKSYSNGWGLSSFDGTSVTKVASIDPAFDEPTVSGGKLFWRGYDGTNGRELWVSDGTAAGTHVAADVNPGGYDSNPSGITSLGNGSVVFSAFNPSTGVELYKSDGTAAGTSLVSDINQTGNHAQSLNINSSFYAIGTTGKALFAAEDGIHGNELWIGDGTSAGSHMVSDAVVGGGSSDPGYFFQFGGKVYYTQYVDGVSGRQLYVSDGTTQTRLTTDGTGTTPYQYNPNFLTLGGKLYYLSAASGGGYDFITTDGTVTGTAKVAHADDVNSAFYQLGSTLVFKSYSNGWGLSSFDGTSVTKVASIDPAFDEPTVSGGKLFWRGYDGTNGRELWVSDGTAAGTHVAADVNPGGYDSNPSGITSLGNGSVVFSAFNPSTGVELYKSDGTAAGTSLVSDINQTGNHAQSLNINSSFYAIGTTGKALFAAEDGIHGNELWIGDGTSAGSHMVSDAVVGGGSSDPGYFFQFGGKVYYTQYVDGVSGRQLYVSDGTTQTRLTTDGTGTTPYQYNPNFLTLGGKLYYLSAASGGGYDFITTDGTVTGTAKVAHADDVNSAFYQLGSTLVFKSYSNGWGLSSFDGTSVTKVASIDPAFDEPTVSGGKLFWRGYDGTNGRELWVSDGTAAGTHVAADVNPGGYDSNPSGITSLGNGSVVFSADDGTHGRELYVSDGTVSGTKILADIFPGNIGSDPQELTRAGNKVFFTANYYSNSDGAHGRELWVTDGTSSGTHMVKDIVPGSGSPQLENFFVFNDTFFMRVYNGTWGLWTSDGTDAGTHAVTASDGTNVYYPYAFFKADATHFYVASNSGLFYSDGTSAGTTYVGDTNGFDPAKASMVNGALFFQHYDSANGYELWTSDGTAAGTHQVTDTLIPNSSNPSGYTFAGGKVFFTADDGAHGRELWVTDGTSSGTHMVKDIVPGSGSPQLENFFVFNDTFFMRVYNGTWGLWTSDGTDAGTHAVTASDGTNVYYPYAFFKADATHFYVASNSGLFYSDGTSAGTTYVGDTNGFDPAKASMVNGALFFQHYDSANGYELWTSDGTAAGTHQVTDALIPNSSNPSGYTFAGGKVFFTADDGAHGRELWVTDGTSSGTHMVKDIVPGSGSPQLENFFVFNDTFFMRVYNGTWGLWTSDGTDAGTHAVTASDGTNVYYPYAFFKADATHFYVASNSGLFYSDGTSAGTTYVGDTNGFDPAKASMVNGALFFQHYDSANGYELWTSDGTAAGTHQVTDTLIPNSSNPGNFAAVNNVPPTVSHAGPVAITDQNTTHPFQAVVIADADTPVQTMTVTITADDPARGMFTTKSLAAASVVAGGTNGSYTFVGTPAQATAALEALVFVPRQNALVVGQSETTNFAIAVNDGAGGSVINKLTKVTVTSANDAPVATGETVAVNEDATAAATTRATGLLANDTDVDIGETATLKVTGAHFGTAADTAVAASGMTTIKGTYGDLLLNADGTYSYTPNSAVADALPQGQAATEVFSYTISDVHGATSAATLTFNITGQNDAPVATGETVAVNEDATAAATTRATGLLANDTDVDTGETATLTVTGAHFGTAADTAVAASGMTTIKGTYGDLLLNADGTYSYTPNSAVADALPQGQAATEVFSYTISDVHGATSATTLTFNITGQNDAPVATGETVAVNEDATAAATTRATGLLANDTDVDTGETATLTVTGAHFGTAADTAVAASGTTTIKGTYGDLLLNADGTYSYTPNSAVADALPQGQAATEVFSYTISDVHGATSATTLTFKITGTNDAPVATADVVAVNEDATAAATTRATGLLANDTDVDTGETATLTVTGAHFGTAADTAVAASGMTTIKGTYGDLLLNADGTYSYTPNSAVADALPQGQAATEVFSYTISDVHGATSAATLTFNITGQNDAPVATGETVAVNEDATAAATTRATGLLANDTDVDTGETATLTVTGAHFGTGADTAVAASGMTTIKGTYGDLLLNADGTYSYTPNSAVADALPQGQAATEVFSYTISDVHGATSATTLTFKITGTNDAPVATADVVAVNEDATAAATTRATGLLANDTDVDTGETATLTVTGAHFGTAADTAVAASGMTTIKGTYGDLLLNADGTYSYTPNSAVADALPQGQAATEVFSYTISDVHGATSAATLTFNITGQNDAPVATGETVAVNEDATAAATTRATGLLANDTDVDTGETATLTVTGAHFGTGADTAVAASGMTTIKGTYGDLLLNADGTYSYTPNSAVADALPQGQAATEVFSYTISDVHGATSATTLTFKITGTNDAPVATADVVAVNEDATAAATTRATGLLANDTDVDTGETATLTVTGAHFGTAADTAVAASGMTTIKGTYGDLLLNADGTYSYTPNSAVADALPQGQAATEVFSYTISDVHGATSAATLTFNITGQNDAPVATGETVAVNEDATAAATTRATGLLANDTDVDTGETATLTVTGAHFGTGADTAVAASGMTTIKGTYGDLLLNADGTYSYTPNSAVADALSQGQAATEVFSYTISDVHGATSAATLTFNITGQNDAPVLAADATAVHAVSELAGTTGSATADTTSATLAFTDVDLNDHHTVSVAAPTITWSGGTTLPSGLAAALAGKLSAAVSADSTERGSGSVSASFSAPDSTFDFLAAGEKLTVTYNVTVDDGHGGASTQPVTITVTGTNDAPVLAADATAVHAVSELAGTTGSATADTTSATLAFTDVDLSDKHVATVAAPTITWSGGSALPSGLAASLASALKAVVTDSTGSGSGSVQTSFSAADSTFDFLAAGEKLTVTYNVTVDDGRGGTSTQPVTITVTGTNDAPVLAADATAVHAVSELAGTTGSATADTTSATLAFTDVDLNDHHTVSVAAPTISWSGGSTLPSGLAAALAGKLSAAVSADSTGSGSGSVSASFSAADSTFDFLAAGDKLTVTYSVTVDDGHGGTSTQPVTITVTGTNDAPVATADVVAVNEDATAAATTRATGLLANDTDVDTGETATLTVTGAHFGTAADTAVAASGMTTIKGTYGDLLLNADGTYSYTPNSAVADALPQGQAATEVFSYTISDVHGATSAATLTFNITGQNDAPVATGETVAVNEDATAAATTRATGLLANDTDVDTGETATLTVTGAHFGTAADTAVAASGMTTIKGTYGDLLLNADGTYSYTPNSAVPDGQVATEVFSYTISDVHGATSATTLTFKITGQSDAVAVDDTNGVLANATIAGATVLSNDHDADGAGAGAALQVGAVNGLSKLVGNVVSLASGALLTLRADGTYDYNPNHAFDKLSGAVGAANHTATDNFSYSLMGGGTANAIITVTGVASPGEVTLGTPGNDVIYGSDLGDYLRVDQGGRDQIYGGAANDAFYFGSAFTSADVVDGGGGDNNQIGLDGDYTGANALTLGASTIKNIQVIAALPGHSYSITTVDANVAAGQILSIFGGNLGAGDNLTFNGSAETDGSFRVYGGLGTDRLTGGAGNDGFYFGPGKYNPAVDFVDGGGGTNNQLALDGNYTVTLTGASVKNIQVIALLKASDGSQNSFAITTDDTLVAAGKTMAIYGAQLTSGFSFNGSAETDGRFVVFGGAGNDTIRGGAGDDVIYGGLGADILTGGGGHNTFRYDSAADSTSTSQDTITDFKLGDLLDLSRIDANSNTASQDAFTFIGSSAFHNHAGELRYQQVDATTVLIQGDVHGNGVADFSVLVHVIDGHIITQADFVL